MCFGETLAWNKVLLPHLFNAETQYPGEMSALEKPKTFWSNNQRGSVADPNINVYDLAPAINGYDPLHIEEVREVICAVRHEGMYFRKIRDWEPFSGNQRGGLFLKRSLWLARSVRRRAIAAQACNLPGGYYGVLACSQRSSSSQSRSAAASRGGACPMMRSARTS